MYRSISVYSLFCFLLYISIYNTIGQNSAKNNLEDILNAQNIHDTTRILTMYKLCHELVSNNQLKQSSITFFVKNSGIGTSFDEQEKVFNRFTKLEDTKDNVPRCRIRFSNLQKPGFIV